MVSRFCSFNFECWHQEDNEDVRGKLKEAEEEVDDLEYRIKSVRQTVEIVACLVSFLFVGGRIPTDIYEPGPATPPPFPILLFSFFAHPLLDPLVCSMKRAASSTLTRLRFALTVLNGWDNKRWG